MANYPYQYPYPPQPPYYQSPQQRLQALEQQYPQFGQAMPSPQQTPQPQQPTQNPIMSVASEQQARDYPADLSGAVQIFVMQDDSAVFAKRFDLSSATIQFEAYERKTSANPPASAPSAQDGLLILNVVNDFTEKLNAIQGDISALRKDVQNGNQFGSGDTTLGGAKPADESSDGNGAKNGKRGAKPAGDN